MTGRVLLIGKCTGVLRRLQAALREHGVDADVSRDVGRADAGRPYAYDAVAFGRAVSSADRARMREAFRQGNPAVVFVDGLAPIIPLLVAQFEEALDRRPEAERRLGTVERADGRPAFELRSEAEVSVVDHRLTPLDRVRTTRLLDARLPSGSHALADGVGKGAFLVVRAGGDEVKVG